MPAVASWMVSIYLASVGLTTGCSKKHNSEISPASNSNSQTAKTDSQPAKPGLPPPGPQPAQPPPPSANPQGIHDMERVLVGYVIRTHQRPASFEAFVAATQIQVPPPPDGQKYAIAKNMHIVLVNK